MTFKNKIPIISFIIIILMSLSIIYLLIATNFGIFIAFAFLLYILWYIYDNQFSITFDQDVISRKKMFSTKSYQIKDIDKIVYLKYENSKKILIYFLDNKIPYTLNYEEMKSHNINIEEYFAQYFKTRFENKGDVSLFKFINNKY